MSKHWDRTAYLVCGDGVIEEPAYLSGQDPTPLIEHEPIEAMHHNPARRQPRFKFGRMFGKRKHLSANEYQEVIAELVKLGLEMNKKVDDGTEYDSDIPAGYTYLGQFIAHEITFDKTEEPLASGSTTKGYRSPQIDLDSLYGLGPEKSRHLYQDVARLKVGETFAGRNIRKTFFNDLPRAGFGSERIGKALIPDPRNDENLPVGQTHLAFLKFHNKIVDELHLQGCPPDQLFEAARKEVVQHFQAIILEDYLPKLLHERGLECVRSGELKFFDTKGEYGVFMPLEFSVAAFRFGHSMVRDRYEWNYVHCSEPGRPGAAGLLELFAFTHFSGNLGKKPRLESDWIIDWRRFYDLTEVGYPVDGRRSNKARKIDATFSLHIESIPGYPHHTRNADHQSIAVRNLLRGFAFSLLTGEEIADKIGEVRLTRAQLGIDSPILKDKTPLWYYLLKEAELNGGKLGPVASCIIAETLVGLIKESSYSLFDEPEWRPKFGRRATPATTRNYEMIDVLEFAEVVDPLGDYLKKK